MRCLAVFTLLSFILFSDGWLLPAKHVLLPKSTKCSTFLATHSLPRPLYSTLDRRPERSQPQNDRNRRNRPSKSIALLVLSIVGACKRISRESSLAIRKFLISIPVVQYIMRFNKAKASNSRHPVMSFIHDHILVSLAIALATAIYIHKSLQTPQQRILEIPFSTFYSFLTASSPIKSLRVAGDVFYYTLMDGRRALTRNVYVQADLLKKILESGIPLSAPPKPSPRLPALLSVLYLVFLARMASQIIGSAQDKNNRVSPLDKRVLLGGEGVGWDVVGGQEEAKREVKEVVDMVKNMDVYAQRGARLPSGILLVGPPGSGKTLLARVVAAESNVPFFSCSATDFVEVFVGRGPARVRKLFETARQFAPSILFIDEIDSVGGRRGRIGANSEQENTLNQLLTCMDGLEGRTRNNIIVMAATNRKDVLDPALLRAGRFDRVVYCPLPNREGRETILRVHSRNMRLAEDVDLARLSVLTRGLSGADLAAIVNEAAIRSARRDMARLYSTSDPSTTPRQSQPPGSLEVTQGDFSEALASFYKGRAGFDISSGGSSGGVEGLGEWLGDVLQGFWGSGNKISASS